MHPPLMPTLSWRPSWKRREERDGKQLPVRNTSNPAQRGSNIPMKEQCEKQHKPQQQSTVEQQVNSQGSQNHTNSAKRGNFPCEQSSGLEVSGGDVRVGMLRVADEFAVWSVSCLAKLVMMLSL